MLYKLYEKTAVISSAYFTNPVKIVYHQYQTFTDSISKDAVKMAVIKPIKYEVIVRGLTAEELCRKALSFEIEQLKF